MVKIHAVLFKLEKDGDIYISPAHGNCLVYIDSKEIKGPALLSLKADINIDSQLLKFEKNLVVKKDEPQKNTTQNLKITLSVSINGSSNICSKDKLEKVIKSNLDSGIVQPLQAEQGQLNMSKY